jgi:hypothetical protein
MDNKIFEGILTNSDEGNAEVDLTRHSKKFKDESTERMPAQKEGENIDLPLDGIIETQKAAREYAEEFLKSPEGTIFWAMNSNAARTQEAKFIFDEEMKYIAGKSGAEIIDLENKMPDESILQQVQNLEGKKIVLVNGPMHPGLGIQNYNMDEFRNLIKQEGSEEKVISDWANNPEVAKIIGVEYRKVKEDFDGLLKDIEDVKKKLFPNREIWVKNIGHSGEIEVGLAAITGKNSGEIIKDAGNKLIQTMESAHITIKPDGKKLVEYRDTKYEI